MNEVFDVAIVGASVSGATLANRLGREELRVALIDRDRFPRRKACGEGVSDIALAALQRMGVETDVEALDGKPFFSYRIDLGKRSYEFATRRHRQLRGVGIQRLKLDQALTDQASQLPSVDSRFGRPVKAITREGALYRVDDDEGDTLLARRIVLADGASSAVA